MKTTTPVNREQTRALNALNKVRNVLGHKNRSTFPLTDNPVESLLNDKVKVLTDGAGSNEYVFVFKKKNHAEKASEVLNMDMVSSYNKPCVKVPRSVVTFLEKTKSGSYSNFSSK